MHFITISKEEVLDFQELEGFYDNSIVVTNVSLIEKYGEGCALVAVDWLKSTTLQLKSSL